MKICCVKLIQMKLGGLTMEPVDREERLFSSLENAETWLKDNGFAYGQRHFFNYPEGGKEWFHKDDMHLEYIDVVITEINLDDLSESKFKDLKAIHMGWLPKFFKELKGDEE